MGQTYITSNTANTDHVMSLTNAMAKIQDFYIQESEGGGIKKEFFTIDHSIAFAQAGIKQSMTDSIIWISCYVFSGAIIIYLQGLYLTEKTTQLFFWEVSGSPIYWFAKAVSFAGLCFSTVLCVMMCKYYVGPVTKKAINSLFATRAIFLISFSFVVFSVLGVVYKYFLTDVSLGKVYSMLAFNETLASNVYYFLGGYFRRAIFESAIIAIVASFTAVLLPYASLILFSMFGRKEIELGIEGLGKGDDK